MPVTISVDDVKKYLDNDSYSDDRIEQAISMAMDWVKRVVEYDIFDSGSKDELYNGA